MKSSAMCRLCPALGDGDEILPVDQPKLSDELPHPRPALRTGHGAERERARKVAGALDGDDQAGRVVAQDAEARVAAGVGTDTRGPLTRRGDCRLLQAPLEIDPGKDQDAADDLEPVQRLGAGSEARRARRRTAACC